MSKESSRISVGALLFVLAYLFLAATAALPRPATRWPALNRVLSVFETHLKPVAWKILHPLGLAQNWEMFATIERYSDLYFEARMQGPIESTTLSLGDLRAARPMAKLIRARELFFMENMTGQGRPENYRDLVQWAKNRLSPSDRSELKSAQVVMLWRPALIYADQTTLPYAAQVLHTESFPAEGPK